MVHFFLYFTYIMQTGSTVLRFVNVHLCQRRSFLSLSVEHGFFFGHVSIKNTGNKHSGTMNNKNLLKEISLNSLCIYALLQYGISKNAKIDESEMWAAQKVTRIETKNLIYESDTILPRVISKKRIFLFFHKKKLKNLQN